MSEKVHSAEYFGDARDFWWHDDYIALIAKRVELARYAKVLDVGCGYGHWARVLLPHFSAGVEITSIDPESRSLVEAEKRNAAFAKSRGIDASFVYQTAQVEKLPFPDGHFDLVTAQTVMIHVPDIGAAITEMHRVLAPGGLLLQAEPNNLAERAAQLSQTKDMLVLLELEVTLQRGKVALGEGDNSAGEYLPRYLDQARFPRRKGWQSDRSYGLVPPYSTPQERADIQELRDFFARGWHSRPPETARRFYLAGGGTLEAFERAWAVGLESDRQRLADIDAGTYVIAGGGVFHLSAAWKV